MAKSNPTKKEKELLMKIEELQSRLNETERSMGNTISLLSSVLDNSRDVIVRWNIQKKCYDYVSPSVEALVGYSPDEFIGMDTNNALAMVHPEDIPLLLAGYDLSEEKGKAELEYRQKSKTGEYIWISNHMCVVKDKEDDPIYRISCIRDISKFKQVEQSLRENEEKTKMLIKHAPAGIYEIDFTSRKFTSINDVMSELLGYTKEELMNLDAVDIMGEQSAAIFLERIKNVSLGKKVNDNVEYKIKRKDGTEIWADLNIKFKYTEGKITGAFVIGYDVTERKKIENELRENENQFRTLAENMPQLCWMTNADGWIFWYNKRWYDYTGTTPEQMKGWGWKSVHHSDHIDRVLDKWTSALKDQKPWEDTFPLRSASGEYGWFLSRAFPIRNDKGEIVRWFGTNTDITGRRIAELKLKEAQEKLNIALENGNIGTWEWDLSTDTTIWDERMEKIFNLTPGTFGNTYTAFENCINEEDLPHFREAINDTIKSGRPFETVFRTRQVDGDSKYISTKAILNKTQKGKAIKLTGVCFDVTTMKKGAEQALIKLNEELLRSNKDLQQFAYVASHDLQEPLRMVSSFTQMLEHRYYDKLDKDGKDYIRFAVDGSKRMYDLINGLLTYSRIQTKGKEFAKVKMNDVLEKVMKNLSLKIKEKNAVIVVKKLPVLFADESQMIQLIQNLVENSIKFTSGTPNISVSSKSEEEQYIISVRDKGLGIESQYFERIFQIFQRLHQKEEYEGTGIGLAICKRIAERHGGEIWVESESGKGSTFNFSIPKKQVN
jgi:PAS domain S-box-containing protein